MSTVAARSRSDTDPSIGVLVGVGSGSLGFLLLVAIVNAARVTPFGLEVFLAVGLVTISVAAFTAVVAARVARQAAPADGVLAATARAALVLAVAVASALAYWNLLDSVGSLRGAGIWLVIAPPAASALGALAAAGMMRTRSGVAVIAVLGGSAALLAWAAATLIVVNITWSPLPVRGGQAETHIEFSAMVSGEYDVRLGASSCNDGTQLAAGHYGPGWDETDTGTARESVVIARRSLESGLNTVRVCLRNGIGLGQATVVIEVDEVPPTPPTLRAEPVTMAGDTAVADTRKLRFSGTADPGAQVEVRLDGAEFAKPRVVDGRWGIEWQFASTTKRVVVEVLAFDRALNEARSTPLTIRFDGTDPAAVFSPAYPAIAIECRGRAADAAPTTCRDWGTKVFDSVPQLVPSIMRAVLTDDVEGCVAILVGMREVLVSYHRQACPPGI